MKTQFALCKDDQFVDWIYNKGVNKFNELISEFITWTGLIESAKLWSREADAQQIADLHKGMIVAEVEVDRRVLK